MKQQTEFAIKLAHRGRRDPNGIWREIAARIGQQQAEDLRQELLEKVERDGQFAINAAAESDENRSWALGALGSATALGNWVDVGCPVVVIREFGDAVELANTDPPAWLLTSPHGTDENSPLGLEIGDAFALVANWRQGVAIWIGPQLDADRDKPPLDQDQETRLIQNVGFVLWKRPEGIDVREHRTSPKAMRKRGRLYYPGVEYIINATRDLHRAAPSVEGASHVEGWTLSQRTRVRAHWHHQAHGPGWSEHRYIWIRSYEKGPEDAPLSIHPLKLTRAKDDQKER
jgi:hypothetical protein